MSADCMIPGSDEFRLDELDLQIAEERVRLSALLLREAAMRARIEKLEAERKDLCPHTVVKKESSYNSGSYYDKAQTTHWNVCVRCGATSERKIETHSYYG